MRRLLRCLPLLLCIVLPLLDLAWNLTHLNIGLPDFYGLALPARAFALHGAWPQTPYFPALYPLLLVPFGLAGSVLVGGYILSALGLMLALGGVGRLMGLLVGTTVRPSAGGRASYASPLLLSLVILLAWLMPVWRVVAGSPSVDALYTGLGIWFIVAAAEILVGTGRAPSAGIKDKAQPAAAPRRGSPQQAIKQRADAPRGVPTGRSAVLILWLTSLLLPLLRYHAIILVYPIALALLIFCPRARWTARAALMAGIAGVFINFAGYMLAYGDLPAPVAGLQVRCGIEFEQHLHYPDPQALWDDYAAFADHGRSTPLLADYSLGQVGTHVLRNWVMFLRQPTVLLAIVLVVLGARSNKPKTNSEEKLAAAANRRSSNNRRPNSGLQPPPILGVELTIVAWLLVYTLSLSLAYYTARSALLPCLVGLAMLFLFFTTPALPIRFGLLALLLGGYGVGSRFAIQDFNAHRQAAQASRDLPPFENIQLPYYYGVQESGPLVVNLLDNRWCLPRWTWSGSWLDDPAIPSILVEELHHVPPEARITQGN